MGEILVQDENLRSSDEVLALDGGPWNKSDKFVVDQKSAEKRPTVVLTQRQKNKKAQKLGYVRVPVLPHRFKKCVTCGCQHAGKECWWCNNKYSSSSSK